MPLRSRSLLLALFSVLYVLVAATRASSDRGWGVLAFLALPAALLAVWARSAPPARGEDWVNPVTRTAMRACGFGGALLAAARVAPPGQPPFEAVATLGTTLAGAASLVALARIAPLGGLLPMPKGSQRPYAALVVGVFGVAAAYEALLPEMAPAHVLPDPAVAGAMTITAPVLSLVATIASAWLLRGLRRLDLGARERLTAALTLGWVALVIGVPASLLGVTPAAHALDLAAWAAAFTCTAACLARDPTFVARAQRVLVAVTLLGAPVGLIGAFFAARSPHDGLEVALVTLAAGIVVGLAGRPVAHSSIDPAQSRWLDALVAARDAAHRSDPDAAVTAALTALRQAFGASAASPELFRADPPALLTVDRAGYPRIEPDLAPPPLVLALAKGEPEQTLRTDVLETIEVRRPDIRPALEWLRNREAMSVTLLGEEDETIGALVLPAGDRAHPLALEEVRALRSLADRLTALFSVSSALARSQARAIEARRAADREEDRALRLEHLLASDGKRHEAIARRLARPATVALYSPASRLAAEELERVGRAGSPVSLLAPPGIDPTPYAALVHGVGPRREGPFVVVDGAFAEEQSEASWRDPVLSPLCLAERGTLLVLNVAALQPDAQVYLASALAERRSPAPRAAPLEISLVVSVPATVDTLVATGQLEPALADRLGDRAVPLPPLSARAEDLRAVFVDRLARLGIRLKGRPMGLDPRALARLVEHGWPGNELELDDVLTRALAVADGEVLTSAHLDQIGFVAAPPVASRRGARTASQHPRASEPGPKRRAGA